MNRTAALKLVETPAFYSRQLEVTEGAAENEMSHSMHYSVELPLSLAPSLAAYFISRFSRKGQVVLDPFAGSGAVSLEAALHGRITKSSDLDPLALNVTRSKLAPSDLTDVTLRLQMMNLKRPVELKNYRQIFSAFYDIDTYREILNLRDYLAANTDPSAVFVGVLALSLLHGNNAGYFSAYSHPHIALSADEQQKINFKRAQTPDYRPVAPRLLRKAAFVLREGVPSVLYANAAHNVCSRADARNLTYLPSASVDLIITRPPRLKTSAEVKKSDDQWLRNWFLGISPEEACSDKIKTSPEAWKDFINESLLEMARVLRPGGRAVLEFQSFKDGAETISPDDLVVDLINENLSRYWEAEGVYVQKVKSSKIRNEQKVSESLYSSKNGRALVLRHR